MFSMRVTFGYMRILLSFAFILISFISLAQNRPEGLFINSKAPDFKVKDQDGIEQSVKDLRKKGPVVVLFYRGFWCPYCNRELSRFQDSLQFITEKGATLVAITPESSEGIQKTREKTGASFPIISDTDMKLSKAYQVNYEVDEKTRNRYKSFGTDLSVINQQKGSVYLPVPAVYVINRDGSIVYRFFDADYKRRPSVKQILAELK